MRRSCSRRDRRGVGPGRRRALALFDWKVVVGRYQERVTNGEVRFNGPLDNPGLSIRAERVVADADLEREAGELAALIAAQPPLAVRGTLRAIDASSHMTVRDGLVVEAESQAVCLQSDDMKEAITAFVEQRPPRYTAS